MLGAVMMHGGWQLPGRTALIAVAADADEAAAAAAAGADLVDLGASGPGLIARFRARCPGVPVCAELAPADVVRDLGAARATGALLICPSAEAAGAAGLPAARLLVEVRPGQLPTARQAGWAPLVDADRWGAPGTWDGGPREPGTPGGRSQPDAEPAALAGVLATAALGAWLGAAAVRTRYPARVKRALDMAASIQGSRPPARAIRGLA